MAEPSFRTLIAARRSEARGLDGVRWLYFGLLAALNIAACAPLWWMADPIGRTGPSDRELWMVFGGMTLLPLFAVLQPWIAYVSVLKIPRLMLAVFLLPLLIAYDALAVALNLVEGKGAPWGVGLGAGVAAVVSLVGQVRLWRWQADVALDETRG
jgi:hypothetical protein